LKVAVLMSRFLKTKAAATAEETITVVAVAEALVAEAVAENAAVVDLVEAVRQEQVATAVPEAIAAHQEVVETAARQEEAILLKGKEGPAEAKHKNILA